MGQLKDILREGFADTFYIWWEEIKNVFKDMGVLIFFIIVPLFYPLIYSFLYSNETVHDVPAAVVDNSHSSLSREFLRKVDATADIAIISHCSDMEEAELLMKETKVYGIILIPEDFSDNIARGEQAKVTIYSNMAGLLYYKAMLTATTNVSLDMNKKIKIERAGNTTNRQDEVSTTPLKYEDVSLYNPHNGFASFLIPAVLILIIQQTLLLGIGLAAGTARENNRFGDLIPMSSHYHGTMRIVLGKSMCYMMIYAIMAAYLVCVVPEIFGFVQVSQPFTLFIFMVPYILACIFFSMTCSIFIHHREACFLIFVCTSVPLLFISGISWPGTAIPPFWKVLSWVFPSTWGIRGFVAVNTMGATWSEIQEEYHMLWLQTGIYFVTTCIVYRWQILSSERHLLDGESNKLG
ncbi:MAG: ABC transporter permease [Phocaeicola sp.]|nr:ABC transporter permease [Phocaeicola sp.]MBR1720256.1 ABC transporter permease [Phocaeicola sp.]